MAPRESRLWAVFRDRLASLRFSNIGLYSKRVISFEADPEPSKATLELVAWEIELVSASLTHSFPSICRGSALQVFPTPMGCGLCG